MRNKTLLIWLIGSAVLGFMVVAFLSTLDSPTGWHCAVNPGDPDTVLGQDPRQVTMPRHTPQVDDDWRFKETVFHADGTTPRIVKIVYDNRRNHLVRGNVPIIMYEHYRPDGTLEKDNMVFPEVGLGAGIHTKYRVRYFDATGKQQTQEHYVRENGTTGVISDRATDTFTTYRADGKTLRQKQEYINGEYRTTHYRLDGKTVWWVSGHRTEAKVYFDYEGNPVNKRFTSKGLTNGGLSMGTKSPPVAYREDTYLRPDNTIEYVQVWYHIFDGDFVDALGQVDVYAADGKTRTARITLELKDQSKSRFIKQVELFNADGTRLVRTYRSPDCRESEETFDKTGNSTGKKTFGNGDRFTESFEKLTFRSFHLHWHPGYDTDAYDI